MCWGAGKLPLLEIVFLLERQEQQSDEGVRTISFKSVYGMNMNGECEACMISCMT